MILSMLYSIVRGFDFDIGTHWVLPEDASVAGFTMRDEVVADTNYRLIFRKNPVGADIEIKATDNTV